MHLESVAGTLDVLLSLVASTCRGRPRPSPLPSMPSCAVRGSPRRPSRPTARSSSGAETRWPRNADNLPPYGCGSRGSRSRDRRRPGTGMNGPPRKERLEAELATRVPQMLPKRRLRGADRHAVALAARRRRPGRVRPLRCLRFPRRSCPRRDSMEASPLPGVRPARRKAG